MEDTLRVFWDEDVPGLIDKSLNPCFNGRYSQSTYNNIHIDYNKS